MKNFILVVICFHFLMINAQKKILLSGKVISKEQNKALEFVAITSFDVQTNQLLSYVYSDVNGAYELQIPANVSIYIKAELLGYDDYQSKHFKVTDTAIKNIQLEESAEVLDEVEIFQKKKLIKLQGDKLIFDVAQSGIGEGNSGLETISSLPGMRLDKDDKIVFRGSSNLQVMINGKRSLLTGGALTQYLKTVGGDNIKKIEVITNPSARYDAEGTAGIINIQLKKTADVGLTGNVYSSLGGEYLKNNNGVNLYYQSGNWSMNGSGRFSRFNSINERRIVRNITSNNVVSTAEQINDWFPKSKVYSGKFGIEYSANRNNVFGTSFNFNVYKSDETTEGRTNEYTNQLFNRFTLLDETATIKNKTMTGNVYHTFTTDSLNTKISTQFNYALYTNKKQERTTNQYFLTDNSNYQNDFIIQLNNPTGYKIYNGMLDIEQKLSDKVNLEVGVKYSYVNNDYDSQYAIQSDKGEFVSNLQRSNRLLYKENIFSTYGTIAYNSEKWSVQGGLRIENINYKANSLTTKSVNSKEYTSWFPSLSINRMFENNKFQFSYSRRIQRPKYLDLNPFYEYLDTYNVSVGNPNLQPQFTNVFSVSWINNQKTTLSMYANFNSEVIYYKVAYNPTENITVNSKDNIANSKQAGMSFSTSFSPIKIWTSYFNIDGSYNRTLSDIPDYTFETTGFSWQVSLNNEFNFKNNWKLYANAYYYGGGTDGNWKNNPDYDISFRVRKTLDNGKWRLQLRSDNVLKRSLMSAVVTEGNVVTDWINKWETRRIIFSVMYNFGKGKKKAVKNIDLKGEKSRL